MSLQWVTADLLGPSGQTYRARVLRLILYRPDGTGGSGWPGLDYYYHPPP